METVGKTSDGKTVVAGVFKFYETHGLPLDSIFDCLISKNCIPDWLCFYVEAVSAGMKHDRIIEKLSAAISDSFGAGVRDHVVGVLNKAAK